VTVSGDAEWPKVADAVIEARRSPTIVLLDLKLPQVDGKEVLRQLKTLPQVSDIPEFLSPFGDMTLWNILVSCVVLPYIYPYSRMINRMLWGHILSVAPETSTMEGGARFHFDTSHNRPDPFVARCDHTAPRGV